MLNINRKIRGRKMVFKDKLVRVSALGLMVSVLAACGTIAASFAPGEESLQKLTAREFGVDPKQVSISNIQSEGDGPLVSSATVYYDAKIKGQNRKCYVTTAMGANSSPMCAKPGQSLTKGGSALTGGK
jgi:hypothetical protein